MCRTSSSPTPTRRPAWCSPGGVSPTGSGCRWIEKYLENKFPPIITLLSQEGGMEISPMSDLANNFSSSTLSPSPWRLSGKVGSSFGWNWTLNTFLLQPKKLAFKVESSPEDENFNTSAANSSAMDSSMDSNGFLFILFWQWTLI